MLEAGSWRLEVEKYDFSRLTNLGPMPSSISISLPIPSINILLPI